MDDPWANAWQEPSAAYKRPEHDTDREEDITIPAWEATGTFSDRHSLWGSPSPAHDNFPSWHSPYDDLPLGKSLSSLPATEDIPEQPEEVSEDEEEGQPEPEPEPEPELEIEVEPPPEPPSESPPSASPPSSPDAFGTFESALDDQPPTTEPWTPSLPAFVPESTHAAWGDAAWESSAKEADGHEAHAVVDEWEAAKQQKAIQDKHIPPELLASILLQFTELSNDLYPPLPTPTLDSGDYRASRHKGLDGIDSLNPTVIRLLPTDLTLPPPRPFAKSAIAKHTSEALRLSRSAAFVRFSPLSHYGATKGSTAWEASVKNRPEVVGEADLLPAGWRIVETKKQDAAVVDKKKTGRGGLLSFFGRRSGTPPVVAGGEDSNLRRSSSPASDLTPRASIDSVKSPTSSIKSPTTAVAASAVTSLVASSSTPPPQPPAIPPPLVASDPQSDAGADADAASVPAAAPSAVSRFLGRFGRKATAPAGHQNLALSEGDFDFLADIDGPAGDSSFDGDASSPIMGALLDKPVPLPAKLPPPPRPEVEKSKNGEQGRLETSDFDLSIFGDYNPSHPIKLSAPPLAPSISAPAPAPKKMSPVDSDVDFSAWGFDDEEKSGDSIARQASEPAAATRTIKPPSKQVLNTRAVANARGVVPPPRRAPTAIMSSGSGPSKPPAAVPRLDGAFNFPHPPRNQTQTPIAAFPTPPGNKLAPPIASTLLDDEEFSDFHTHTPTSQPTASSSFYDTSFSSSSSSQHGLFASTSSGSVSGNLFDDFDDFMQASPQEPTTLRTPSPPRLPSKPSHITLPAPPTSFDPQADDDTPLALIAAHGSNSSLRSQRTAESHQRTRSLVENAAATSGIRWPAPASPLPEIYALMPPPGKVDLDPFGFGPSTMQSQQAAFLNDAPPLALKAFPPPPAAASTPVRALSPPVLAPPPGFRTASPMRATSPPVLAPPPGFGVATPSRATSPPVLAPPPGFGVATSTRTTSPPLLSPPSGALSAPMLTAQRTTAVPTPPPLAPGKSSGGLSAQDLSFFEGL